MIKHVHMYVHLLFFSLSDTILTDIGRTLRDIHNTQLKIENT